MDSRFGLSILGGLVAIAVAVAGGATINDRSPANPVAGKSDRTNSETAGGSVRLPAADPDDRAVRRKSRCKDCGVVESAGPIERVELEDGVCTASKDGNIPEAFVPGESNPSKGLPTLSNMARRIAAAQAIAERVPMAPRHRIVVRLRDGTRHVFDESTSRTLRSGDFVRVI